MFRSFVPFLLRIVPPVSPYAFPNHPTLTTAHNFRAGIWMVRLHVSRQGGTECSGKRAVLALSMAIAMLMVVMNNDAKTIRLLAGERKKQRDAVLLSFKIWFHIGGYFEPSCFRSAFMISNSQSHNTPFPPWFSERLQFVFPHSFVLPVECLYRFHNLLWFAFRIQIVCTDSTTSKIFPILNVAFKDVKLNLENYN